MQYGFDMDAVVSRIRAISFNMDVGYAQSSALTQQANIDATLTLGFNLNATLNRIKAIAANMALGYDQVSDVNRDVSIVANMALGFSTTTAFSNVAFLTVNMALGFNQSTFMSQYLLPAAINVGFTMVTALNVYADVRASFAEGFSMSAPTLTRSIQLTASFAYGFSDAILLTHNAPQPTVRPTTGNGAAVALNSLASGTTGTFAVTAGQYILAHAALGSTTGAAPTVSSISGGNVTTWTKLGAVSNSSQANRLNNEVWIGKVVTTGASVTVTVNLSAAASSGYFNLMTWSGVNATTPVADTVVTLHNDSGSAVVPTTSGSS
jgi:hypothetical protein